MPFGKYKDFAACVAANKDKGNPQAYCATVHKKITGQWPSEKGAADEKKCEAWEREYGPEIEKDLEKGHKTDMRRTSPPVYDPRFKYGGLAIPGEKVSPSSDDQAVAKFRARVMKEEDVGKDELEKALVLFELEKKVDDPEEVHAKEDVKPPDVPQIAQPAEDIDPVGSDKAKPISK